MGTACDTCAAVKVLACAAVRSQPDPRRFRGLTAAAIELAAGHAMNEASFDALAAARALREAGFEERQAEAVAGVVRRAGRVAFAAKAVLAALRAGISRVLWAQGANIFACAHSGVVRKQAVML